MFLLFFFLSLSLPLRSLSPLAVLPRQRPSPCYLRLSLFHTTSPKRGAVHKFAALFKVLLACLFLSVPNCSYERINHPRFLSSISPSACCRFPRCDLSFSGKDGEVVSPLEGDFSECVWSRSQPSESRNYFFPPFCLISMSGDFIWSGC